MKESRVRGRLPVFQATDPLYRVSQKCFVSGRRVAPGGTVHYLGVPAAWMEPVNEAAQAAVAKRDKGKGKKEAAAEKPAADGKPESKPDEKGGTF